MELVNKILKSRYEAIEREKEAGTYNPKVKSLIDIFYEKRQ